MSCWKTALPNKCKGCKSNRRFESMGGLNPDTVNTKVLKLAVQAAEVLNQSAYTVSSWSFFEAARLEAEGLLDEIEAAQAEAVNQETSGPADIPEADGLNLEPEKTYVEKVDAEKVNAAIEKLELLLWNLQKSRLNCWQS